MPSVSFDSLPDSARVWVFASDKPLTGGDAERLLQLADDFLDHWKAHGVPLRCAREWRDDRFLVIGVDPTHEQASGCSVDGLFHALQDFQRRIGTRLVGGGRVFYRNAGSIEVADREQFEQRAAAGAVRPSSPVFDTALTSAGDYRARFELPARETWTSAFFSPT